MEPISLAIGTLVVMAMFRKRQPTAASAAATAAEVDQLSEAVQALSFDEQLSATLIAQGAAAADKMYMALRDQITGLGFKIGGVGHPPGPDGKTTTVYITNDPAVTYITPEEFAASKLSTGWDSFTFTSFIAKKDGSFDPAEANNFVREANAIAAVLFELAKKQEGRKKERELLQSTWKQYYDAYLASFKQAGIIDGDIRGLSLAPDSPLIGQLSQEALTDLSTKWVTFKMSLGMSANPTREELQAAIVALDAAWKSAGASYTSALEQVNTQAQAAFDVLNRAVKAMMSGAFSFLGSDSRSAWSKSYAEAAYGDRLELSPDFSMMRILAAPGGEATGGWASVAQLDEYLKMIGY